MSVHGLFTITLLYMYCTWNVVTFCHILEINMFFIVDCVNQFINIGINIAVAALWYVM